jgi:predicted GIY-YIG superfamily endonuclease
MFYVYILQSEKDKKRYIGFTENLDRRLIEH